MSESKNCGTFTQWNTNSREKKGVPTLCNSTDGTGEHYASEISQSVKILYNLTYKWHLVNKTSKHNITRDIEIKNKQMGLPQKKKKKASAQLKKTSSK